MKVLVPLDGSRLADGILAHVRRLLRREKSEVVLLRVLEEGEDEAAARAHLEECRELLESVGEHAELRLTRGDPAEEILAAVGSDHPDLIAMASHGRTGLDRFVRGSVAEKVLRAATVPVFLANPAGLPRGADAEAFNRVVVPMDGSELAGKGLQLALPFLLEGGSEVVLLHIDRPDRGGTHPVPEVAARRAQERAEVELGRQVAALSGGRFAVKVEGRYGDPAAEILDAIVRNGADLVVMSSHGRSGLRRWRFGSVAEKVLRECRCPLLVWRGPEGAR